MSSILKLSVAKIVCVSVLARCFITDYCFPEASSGFPPFRALLFDWPFTTRESIDHEGIHLDPTPTMVAVAVRISFSRLLRMFVGR